MNKHGIRGNQPSSNWNALMNASQRATNAMEKVSNNDAREKESEMSKLLPIRIKFC